jgi:hypothetical protein
MFRYCIRFEAFTGENAMKSSRAINGVRMEMVPKVSETVSVSIMRSSRKLLMMAAETVSETLDTILILTRLIAREDFTAFKYISVSPVL